MKKVFTFTLRGLLLPVIAAAAVVQPGFAQTSGSSRPAGLEADWDIAPVLQQLSVYAGKLTPALDRLDPWAWESKGASGTYLRQLQSSKEQARALADQAKALTRFPEKLSATLEVMFRVQGLDVMLSSLVEGARRYQSPADADALEALAVQDGVYRDRLQGYIVNLAVAREHDLDVMDREAQRCRGVVTQPPAKTVRKP